MKINEIQTIFAAIQGASDKTQLAVASAMYAVEQYSREQSQIAEDLLLIREMITHSLNQFDWGGSCLDAKAISLLNRAPDAIERIIDTLGIKEPT